jgi:putative ABC transport system ATP-binding protein
VLTINHISKIYNAGSDDEVRALQDISVEVKKGDFLVVVGTNGSGKSTLLNLILGTILPTTGSVSIDGKIISHLPEFRRSPWVSMVFQNPANGTAPDLSIVENFRLAALRSGKKGIAIGNNKKFRQLVKEKVTALGMGLENKIDQSIGSLSGGQRQALTLLMGVMDKTSLLLMDEPTAALDPKSAKVVMELAEQINGEMGITIILITHSMKDALQYGDRLIMFDAGKIVKDLNKDAKQSLTITEMLEWFA